MEARRIGFRPERRSPIAAADFQPWKIDDSDHLVVGLDSGQEFVFHDGSRDGGGEIGHAAEVDTRDAEFRSGIEGPPEEHVGD